MLKTRNNSLYEIPMDPKINPRLSREKLTATCYNSCKRHLQQSQAQVSRVSLQSVSRCARKQMLCCVPKRPVEGHPFYDENPARLRTVQEIQIELYPEEDAPSQPSILLPCAICSRTFMPQSLEKHARICQRTATKKRKPFDSAKQRIQGTELAEFLPKQETIRHRHQDERGCATRGGGGRSSSWKKTHDDFLRAIREAREEVMDPHKQCKSVISSRAPTRAHEKNICPTCNRHFGIKAYDRHVAWCKERITQVSMSPATNLAKERLEARMRYRAPVLKNRRAANREKYSPGATNKTITSSAAIVKPKQESSIVAHNRENTAKQKSAVIRRPGNQLKESSTSSGPMKSRPADRVVTRQTEEYEFLSSSLSSSHFAISSRRSLHFPVPPLKPKIDSPTSILSKENVSPVLSTSSYDQIDGTSSCQKSVRSKEGKGRELVPKVQKSIRSGSSYPRINDIAVNDNALGVTVRPYKIHKDTQKNEQLVTWEQISRKKDNDSIINHLSTPELQLLNINQQLNQTATTINTVEYKVKTELMTVTGNMLNIKNQTKDSDSDKVKDDDGFTWLDNIQDLNQTYLIKDSEDIERPDISYNQWKPIKHSPHVNFYVNHKDRSRFEKKSGEDDEVIKVIDYNMEEGSQTYNNVEKKNIRLNTVDIAENAVSELIINKRSQLDQQVVTDPYSYPNTIEENKKRHKHNEATTISDCDRDLLSNITQNLSKSVENIQIDTSRRHEESYPNELTTSFIDDNNYSMSDKSCFSNSQIDLTLRLDDADSLRIISNNSLERIDDNLSYKDGISESHTDTEKSPMTDKNTSMFTHYRSCDRDNSTFVISPSETNHNSDPENNVLSCANNISYDLSYLTENTKKQSTTVMSENDIQEDAGNDETMNFKETEINEEIEESTMVLQDQNSARHSNQLNCEISENFEIVADNYLYTDIDRIFSQHNETDKEQREKSFNVDNIEILKDSRKIAISDDNSDKSMFLHQSIDVPKTLISENLHETCEGNINIDLDYCDNTIKERDETHRSGSSHEKLVPDMNVKPAKQISSCFIADVKERPVNPIVMKRKIRENMNIFRSSTDSLVSSVEFVGLSHVKQPKANDIYEKETIEIIQPSIRNRISPDLPGIKDKSTETMERLRRSEPVNQTYWERVSRISQNRLITLNPSYRMNYKLTKRNPRIRILPPVPCSFLIRRRGIELTTRPAWNNYVRRRPDFNLVLRGRIGTCKDYDPFLLAEQQMNELLSDMSDQSVMDSPKTQTRDNFYPLSHSSAFVKYPSYQTNPTHTDRVTSSIAPPTEFDDLVSNFSSDSTETNSISREVFLKDLGNSNDKTNANPKPVKELGRRMIIDKSQALGGGDFVEEPRDNVIDNAEKSRKIFDKVTSKPALKTTRPTVARSSSIRASSAPKSNLGTDRRTSSDMRKANSKTAVVQRSSDTNLNNRNNNYSSLSGSNLSLSSIVSSEIDVKRSNSMFDELMMTSFEEDRSAFPNLRSFLNNDSFNMSSSTQGDRQQNSLISDEESSSPDSYKPREHGKLSNDSAYSSLNRKYSHNGRSTNDVAGRLDENASRNESRNSDTTTSSLKMSKFCHECGLRFPEMAKFCCECGIRRLAL